MRRVREGIIEKLDQSIQELESEQPLSRTKRDGIANKLRHTKKEFNKLRTWVELSEEISDIGLWEHDLKNDTTLWSDENYRIWGYEPYKVVPSETLFFDRIHEDDREKVQEMLKQSRNRKQACSQTFRLQFPDGEFKYIKAHAVHFYDQDGEPVLTVGTNQNITERELEKRQIIESLEENKTMLDEIHHRVKNNLAVVAGMLQLQWLQEEDPIFANKLQDSANRIKTVAGIHEQLYESSNFSDISLGKNIENLARNLIQSMEIGTDIELVTDCDEINLDFRHTLPCSLIANEVITNAIKYAFEEKQKGTIQIQLKDDDTHVKLLITDNGVGLPEEFHQKEGSLGMSLIDTLSAQLNADYDFNTSPGV